MANQHRTKGALIALALIGFFAASVYSESVELTDGYFSDEAFV